MIHLFSVLCVAVFPALALKTMRTGGPASLWRTTGLGLAVIAVLALVSAAPWAGNALSPTYGYGHIAVRSLLLFGLVAGLPLISAAFAVRCFAAIRSGLGVYLLGVACAAAAWYVGIIAAIRILYSIG